MDIKLYRSNVGPDFPIALQDLGLMPQAYAVEGLLLQPKGETIVGKRKYFQALSSRWQSTACLMKASVFTPK